MDNCKDTNPKDVIGVRKVQAHLIPAAVILEESLAMLEGACKYGAHNYRIAGVRASVYYDAIRRHVDAWWEGQDTDPDSGLHHLAKARACLAVLRDSQMRGNWIDDRPPRNPDGASIDKLNVLAAQIIDKYPDPKPPYIESSLPAVKDPKATCAKKRITAYLSHPIRGAKGLGATAADKDRNNQAAVTFAARVRAAFPEIDLYVPAESEGFVQPAHDAGILNESMILEVDKKILACRDVMIVFDLDHFISRGMSVEIDEAKRLDIPYIMTGGSLDPVKELLEA